MILPVWFVVGAALGLLNTLSQWWTVEHLSPETAHETGVWIVVSAVLRLIVAVGVLLIAARQGFWPVGLTLAGFWLTRTVALGWVG